MIMIGNEVTGREPFIWKRKVGDDPLLRPCQEKQKQGKDVTEP